MEVEGHIHKDFPVIPILIRINPISHVDIHFSKTHDNIVLPSMFAAGLPVTVLKALISSSILATCPAYPNLLNLIALIVLGECCRMSCSSLAEMSIV